MKRAWGNDSILERDMHLKANKVEEQDQSILPTQLVTMQKRQRVEPHRRPLVCNGRR